MCIRDRNADIALYQSKRQGKNQVQFYLPSMKQEDVYKRQVTLTS